MNKSTWGDVFALVVVLAAVYALVRPASQAPAFLTAFGDGMTALIEYAVAP